MKVMLLAAGFALLIYGADFLVRGACSLARRLGVRPLIVGLSVVAFGTSAPELAVNFISAHSGAGELALGNVLGSNLANILLVLGLAAIVFSVKFEANSVWTEMLFLILVSTLALLLARDVWLNQALGNSFSRIDGLVLVSLFLVFLHYIFHSAKLAPESLEAGEIFSWPQTFGWLAFGLAGLFFGGGAIVEAAVYLAKHYGMSEHAIGATITAVGTSLPELAATMAAVFKKQVDLAVGNVVGSNIFNLLLVLGATAVFWDLPVNSRAGQDALFGLAAAAILLLCLLMGKKYSLERYQGAVLIGLYFLYLGYCLAAA